MKSILSILVSIELILLIILVGCVRTTDLSDDLKTLPLQTSPNELVQETHLVESPSHEQAKETPPHQYPTPELPEVDMIVDEMQDYLSWYFDKMSYIPNLNKQEDGILLYCFTVEYPIIIGHNLEAYVWVNSVTWDLEFAEFSPYANIPDSLIPTPTRDGLIVAYERFEPPFSGSETTSYMFYDTKFEGSYKVQLNEAGFVNKGSIAGFDSLWVCEQDENMMTLIVGLTYVENSLLINMLVTNYSHLDYDEIFCLCDF